MGRNEDLEGRLMSFGHETDPRVKRAVMEEFCRRRPPRTSRSVWVRPVPLYAVLALVLLAAGLSWVLGQRLTGRGSRRSAEPLVATWATAERDLIRVMPSR
jgi:hypothetical protein